MKQEENIKDMKNWIRIQGQ